MVACVTLDAAVGTGFQQILEPESIVAFQEIIRVYHTAVAGPQITTKVDQLHGVAAKFLHPLRVERFKMIIAEIEFAELLELLEGVWMNEWNVVVLKVDFLEPLQVVKKEMLHILELVETQIDYFKS